MQQGRKEEGLFVCLFVCLERALARTGRTRDACNRFYFFIFKKKISAPRVDSPAKTMARTHAAAVNHL